MAVTSNARTRKAPGHNSPTVLLIAPHPVVRCWLAAVLRSEGWSVLRAAGGHEAMQRASPRQPDLVVVDLPLNLLSGEATLQALRMEFGHALPVIALVPRKHQALARNLRASTILEVPFEVADLVTAAHSAVQA